MSSSEQQATEADSGPDMSGLMAPVFGYAFFQVAHTVANLGVPDTMATRPPRSRRSPTRPGPTAHTCPGC